MSGRKKAGTGKLARTQLRARVAKLRPPAPPVSGNRRKKNLAVDRRRRTRGDSGGAAKSARFDPQKSLEINVTSRSPHVAAYRLWTREPQGDWQRIGEGHTEDDQPDFYRVPPLPDGSEIAYWLGIGGNPSTSFRVLVALGQGGRLLEGGTRLEEGRTDEDGIAQREGGVTLRSAPKPDA